MTTTWSDLSRKIQPAHHVRRRAFSLIELLVVLAVVVILTALLMPAISNARAHAERIISAARMRQIGMGMSMYAMDSGGRLPYSALLRARDNSQLQEMMALYIGEDTRRRFQIPDYVEIGIRGFEGLGLLYTSNYLAVPNIFYSPSHTGDHPVERYAGQFHNPEEVIYGNFHYRGDMDIFDRNRAFTFEHDSDRAFVTDGMRTKRDLNHRHGFHRLFGDGSVQWQSDLAGRLYQTLPELKIRDAGEVLTVYRRAWQIIDDDDDDDDGIEHLN